MRRPERLAGAALLALAATAAQALTPCTLVFGQGRNPPAAGTPDWDGLNAQFSAAVASALDEAGRRVVAMTASSAQIDPQATGLALLQRADESGCGTLVETTVFADEQDALVLRLRVYPLLPQLDGGGIVGLHIGAPLFVTQRELALSTLPRLRPGLLAAQMAAEYLQNDRR
ncbi:hypothetical protein [Roseateles saccharophilus]|uniref:FlgO domain-containing protein n=1 Tax=Roseateles saccharophilus TaxID=304 RepID=A0A4R3VFZ8_ROSSA|nr:hypothetical protein [Roseateles saccharophilus]MDG0831226.1 hypothetical protein [Roseateles saccharophilus]TCV04347.1 hypothetical protein EV671_1001102 [Roseateles saccharophilus]